MTLFHRGGTITKGRALGHSRRWQDAWFAVAADGTALGSWWWPGVARMAIDQHEASLGGQGKGDRGQGSEENDRSPSPDLCPLSPTQEVSLECD